MSAGAGIWKHALLKVTRAHAKTQTPSVALPVFSSPSEEPISSLVRQVFFPSTAVRRRRIFFVSADPETRIFVLCEQVGKALSEISGSSVAIMETPSASAHTGMVERKRPCGGTGVESWRLKGSQIGDGLWRVPSEFLSRTGSDGRSYAGLEELPFDYVLFAAAMNDSVTPLFSSFCDGAVLALTANRTRRESAIRAKQQLQQWNAELLGAVLDGRVFPIPEAIYRRI
jgi:hypothetical protein